MAKPLTLFVFLIAWISCTVDYNIPSSFEKEKNRLIVNGYLNPDSMIRIRIYTLQVGSENTLIRGAVNSHITLKEDEKVLFDAYWKDSLFALNYYPKIGAHYSIQVSLQSFPTVYSSTYIPFGIESSPQKVTANYNEEYTQPIIQLTSFDNPSDENKSLWITCYQLYDNNTSLQYNELYTNHVLVDKANSVAGMDVMNSYVGSIYHNGFLRIKHKNLSQLKDLFFTPNYVIDGSKIGFPKKSRQTAIGIKLITASPEYDKYNTTLYEQKHMVVYDEGLSSIFYQPKSVYCNIENGLGIFAGLNEANYRLELPQKND